MFKNAPKKFLLLYLMSTQPIQQKYLYNKHSFSFDRPF